jgi:cysteine desulfurase
MAEVMAEGGNPSSVHGRGRAARARVDEARRQVAGLVNALPPEVVFTGSGTEATDLAINGVAPANGITDLVVASVEHPASHGAAKQSGLPVTHLPVTGKGVIDLAAAEEIFGDLAAQGRKTMVVVMRANNETGSLQPVQEIAQMVRDREIGLVHCDAVQSAGKIPVDAVLLGADTMALSAHKIGGPQGVGALVVREGVPITPRVMGGGQEMGRRSGTENVAGIAGFGLAAELAARGLSSYTGLAAHRDRMEAGLKALSPTAVVFGEGAERLPNTCCFAVPGIPAETALMALDLGGVEVSSGSACSSGKVAANHVLAAMGVGEALRMGALRVSLGWGSEPSDVDAFLTVWERQVMKMCGGMAATGAF